MPRTALSGRADLVAHVGQELALRVARLLGLVPLPAQVAALVDDRDVDRGGDGEDHQAADLIVPAERAIRGVASGTPAAWLRATSQATRAPYWTDGRKPGDDAHPHVLAQAGERQSEEVDAEEDPAVGDREGLAGDDQGQVAPGSRC